MSPGTSKKRKTFTIQQANAALPLVRAIVNDFVQLSREIAERRERLSWLSFRRPRDNRDLYSEELAQIEEELQNDSRRLRDFVEELRHLGLEAKSSSEGLVDFPALLDGRPVNLCWKLGEPEILYWHGRDETFHDRKPLIVGSAADSGPETAASAN